jgi:putative salt-induced outer membrane protein YdiY
MGPYIMFCPEAIKGNPFSEMTKTGAFFSISSARHRNDLQLRSMPKDVVKNWMRINNAIEFLGLWEVLNNPEFKGVEFDPFKK